VFLSSAFFGAIIILIAVRGIVKPIKRLGGAAREVSKGQFDIALEVGSADEIGRLTEDFNTMVREIGAFDKMRHEFVSNVSHEFRTPITSIRGYAKLISENSGDNGNIREYSDTIIRESGRLIDLSSNLLRLSELDNLVIREQTEFALDEQIRRVILSLQPIWEEKNIEFDLDLPEIKYCGDEELLRQVWINLIGNAIKFSHKNGTVRVEISEFPSGTQVIVADNGIGIPAYKIPLIFDRFYKGETPQKSQGNGLGLSIVQKIVQMSGGDVSVRSEVGKGTAVTVDLGVRRLS
jgi:signal transduction histidine kinase